MDFTSAFFNSLQCNWTNYLDPPMLSIAHVLNVTEITPAKHSSYLHIAQPLTMKSMVMARENASSSTLEIELFAIAHASEDVEIPDEFQWIPPMDSYAYESIDALKESDIKRPLPKIADILDGLYHASTSEYVVYTNLDIGLYPNFYSEIAAMISKGHDAICINRRTLPKSYRGILLDEKSIETIHGLKGVRHPGIDCFVFRRDCIPEMELNNVFVGFPPIGQVLKCQIERHSSSFRWVKNRVLTFHIGSDSTWTGRDIYRTQNFLQAKGLYSKCFDGRRGIVGKLMNRVASLGDH